MFDIVIYNGFHITMEGKGLGVIEKEALLFRMERLLRLARRRKCAALTQGVRSTQAAWLFCRA